MTQVWRDKHGRIETITCVACNGTGRFHSPAVGKYISQDFPCPSCDGDKTVQREVEETDAKIARMMKIQHLGWAANAAKAL